MASVAAVGKKIRQDSMEAWTDREAGAGVVTTRAHVHYVVTEHGVAELYGKNLRQRAKALTAIASPGIRESLERDARRRFGS